MTKSKRGWGQDRRGGGLTRDERIKVKGRETQRKQVVMAKAERTGRRQPLGEGTEWPLSGVLEGDGAGVKTSTLGRGHGKFPVSVLRSEMKGTLFVSDPRFKECALASVAHVCGRFGEAATLTHGNPLAGPVGGPGRGVSSAGTVEVHARRWSVGGPGRPGVCVGRAAVCPWPTAGDRAGPGRGQAEATVQGG